MPNTLLRIYQAPSGQWSGTVFDAGEEIADIADCASPGEVEDTARDQFPDIEIEDTPEAKSFWASFEGQPNTDEEPTKLPPNIALWLDQALEAMKRLDTDPAMLARVRARNF